MTIGVSATFARTGTLTRSSNAIRFFDAATGGNEITFNGTDNVFTGAQLTAGVQLFAEGASPSVALDDVQLTLTLAAGTTPVGPPATATMTAVALTLDIAEPRPAPGTAPPPLSQPPATPPAPGTATDKWFGGRLLTVQDSNSSQARALLIVRAVQPSAFTGILILRQVTVDSSANTIGNLDNKAQIFDSEIPGPRQTPPVTETAKNNPHEFNASTVPATGLEFWVEGRNASATERDSGFQLGIKDVENDGDRVALTVAVAPVIALASPTVVVKKTYTAPARQSVTLRTSGAFTSTGTFTRSSAAVRFFDAATTGNEITFNGTDNVFTGAQLTAGLPLFAQGNTASTTLNDIQVTLALTAGSTPVAPPVTATMTAVELTLDIARSRPASGTAPPPLPQPPATAPATGTATDKWFGGRFIPVQDADHSQERALLSVRPVQPTAFNGTLLLRQVVVDSSANTIGGLDTKAQIFDSEIPGPRQTPPVAESAKNNPHEFNASTIPASGLEFWTEGRNASTSLRDSGFQLGIKDLENDGDRISLTTGTFSLRTQGASQVGDRNSKIFATTQATGQNVTVIAAITPTLSTTQANLITWTGGTSAANPAQRTVSRGSVAQTPISAAFAGSTRSIEIHVLADPSRPGPFPVGELDYPPLSRFTVPATIETIGTEASFELGVSPGTPVSNGAFEVLIQGLIRYPAQTAGVDQPVSTTLTQYPLVIIAHGNHRSLDSLGNRIGSFSGLEYLARHLASHGYIVASIDLDDMNLDLSASPPGRRNRDPAIVQRGLTIIEHVRAWNGFNTTHPRFTGKVDLSQIGLIGHSRGGEAVVSAQKTNIDEGRGLNIKGVVSISPTDFLGITIPTIPYLVVYGSADGDVSVGWPFRLYDRADPLKSMIFVYGAIHNRFSTHPDWLASLDSADSRMISETEHLNIARGYCLAFLELSIHNRNPNVIFFKENLRPATVPNTIDIHTQVQDPQREIVDNFEQGVLSRANPLPPQLATRASSNTLGQAVTINSTGLVVPTGLSNALTEASLRKRDLDFFWHETIGAMLAWSSPGGKYITALGGRNVSSFQVLSFRVTQRAGSSRNPTGTVKNFSVALVDVASQLASVQVGTITPIPFPYERLDDPSLTKSALKTVRIPLDTFSSLNTSLNLKTVQSIEFRFDQTSTGEIAIDDIEFSN